MFSQEIAFETSETFGQFRSLATQEVDVSNHMLTVFKFSERHLAEAIVCLKLERPLGFSEVLAHRWSMCWNLGAIIRAAFWFM